MKVIIDRTRWLRGEPHKSKLLRESDGKMCCLGFHALACGYTEEQIASKSTPIQLITEVGQNKYNKNMSHVSTKCDSNIIWNLMQINDTNDSEMTESMREEGIITNGKKIDIEFEFIN